jgi:hypothetical protein
MPALFILIAMLFAEINPPYSDPPALEIHPWHLIPNKGDHHLYMFYPTTDRELTCTVKPAHVVTSIKQSPVLKGHLFSNPITKENFI